MEIQGDCYCLRQATRRVTQLFDRTLAPLNLRSTQYSLLSEIDRLGPISLIPLAEAIVMDRATLGHNLRPLEARGLVKVVVGQDRRSRQVSLTKAGKEMLGKGAQLWRHAQLVFEEAIGREESARLRAALLRVAAADFGEE
ncbi:MarR family winged helix-turn-helix transcriptional regulator [Acidisoma sp. C75]